MRAFQIGAASATKGWLSAVALAAGMLAAGAAQAGPYSNLYIFGDSLSDTGNLSIASGGAFPGTAQPYYMGRFSDGPVWVEHLASALGLGSAAAPSLLGGNNYAFAGARTGLGGGAEPPGLLTQYGMWDLATSGADPAALYVVVAGGNDLRDGRTAFRGDTLADNAGRQAAADSAVANLRLTLQGLFSQGAKSFLLATMPDLGATPEAAALGSVAASSDITTRFNSALWAMANDLEATFGLDIDVLDFGLGNSINDDARNGGPIYGIVNTVLPCAGFQGSTALGNVAYSCSVSLFSDALHPSARAHAIVGAAAAQLVPEPSSLLLLGAAALALRLSRRRA